MESVQKEPDGHRFQTRVLIVGGGVTGTGLARDLALRGIACVLVEKGDINAGASGGNHGLLHSGARYIASDPAAAAECRRESLRLKRLAPHCIEETGGLFVAVAGDDENYVADFPGMCARSGIPTTALDPGEARELEPSLSDRLIAAYRVEDAAVDPFRLSLDNIAHAQDLGSRLMRNTRLAGFDIREGRVRAARLIHPRTGRRSVVEAEVVVNAAGAWAGQVAAMAGIDVPILYSKGSLLVTSRRISHHVVNRLRKPTDGDILVPGGTVSILGTTSERIESPDRIYPEIHEVDRIVDEGAAMIPELTAVRYIRAYCGVRPLIGSAGGSDDRTVSRGFALIDHGSGNPAVSNFLTITGGKLTTFRLMAEKTADRVCRMLGHCDPCRTREEPLPDTVDARWTAPGLAPRMWLRRNEPDDLLLCECEMVSRGVVDEIVGRLRARGETPGLDAIGLRSRIGKGPCQGTFCNPRTAAHLYDRGEFDGDRGLDEMRAFARRRWRGQHPLLWDTALSQAELLEAMHCGLFGLDGQ